MINPITPSTLFQIDNDITTAVPMGSFEDKVRQLFAEYTVAVGSEKADLINKANNIDVSNPAELLKIQNQVGNYNLAMSTLSTLTHKSVSAIDTILKAQ